MGREKFFCQTANLDIIPAQPGKVLYEHRRNVPVFDSLDHLLEAGALHGCARDPIVHKKQGVCVTLFLCGLLENFLLGAYLSRVNSTKKYKGCRTIALCRTLHIRKPNIELHIMELAATQVLARIDCGVPLPFEYLLRFSQAPVLSLQYQLFLLRVRC